MELKKYQKTTLEALHEYIMEMRKYDTEKRASVAFMVRTDRTYNWVPEIGRNPFVCIKVPTGGGKTLIASHAVGSIFKDYLGERNDTGLVMWFVPSDAIKTQTLNNLRQRNHPYRGALDERFDNAVKVFDLSEAKAMKRDDIADNVCIVVSTLSAFRRTNKEGLKAYQDNGALMAHFGGLNADDFDFLDKNKEGEIIYSLVNLIRLHQPLVIADEGHNVQTDLSFDMLKGLNPSFVLEFTATPRPKSNVLVSVAAQELKNQKMIKMPILLANKTPWQETISEGIAKRSDLEKRANKIKSEYIRPIMLIQAEQEIENKDKAYVDRIWQYLVEDAKIPAEEIVIQTSTRKELPDISVLSSRVCPIRYIITVNALREGWDCPFAYVLVSVSHLGARLSVEQTIGRIMRLPYAAEKDDSALNQAYIFATTQNFSQASEAIIKGLEANGYEGIIAKGKTICPPDKEEYGRKIDDPDAAIPYINIREDALMRKLNYVGDLIGDAPLLKGKGIEIDFHPIANSQIAKIDFNKEGLIAHDAVRRLPLAYHYKDFTKDDLLAWFCTRIQRGFISLDEMKAYLTRALHTLLARHSLQELSVHRYQIRDAMERKIDEIVNTHTKKVFDNLRTSDMLIARGESFICGDRISLLHTAQESFHKHLYERAAPMNKEELIVAQAIDNLGNIGWWLKNPEMSGFYLQGWEKDKFYPDFIAKTKNRKYIVVEYKGVHLVGDEDSTYKKELGKHWESLGEGTHQFFWIEQKNRDQTINEIGQM